MSFQGTPYFYRRLQKCPEITLDYVSRVLASPLRVTQQNDGRFRYWGYVVEQAKWLRVITLRNGTVHNAFFDRRFKP